MLAVSLSEAKKYSNNPVLIARDIHDEKKNIYYVEDSALPCQNCPEENPLNMLTKKQIWSLRKKYKISARVLKKIEKCYKNPNSTEFELGKECESLEVRIFLEELENLIINSLKTEVRLGKNTEWIPFYDPADITTKNMHSTFSGPSSSGKTTICSKCIKYNFPDAQAWIFGPLVTKDKVWLDLYRERGKKKIKLIDSDKVTVPIHLDEITKKKQNILVCDDPDSMMKMNRDLISSLCETGLFHGRHVGLLCMTIAHDSFSRKVGSVKAQACESARSFVFPNIARHVTTKYLKNRLGMSAKLIADIYKFVKPIDRWLMVKTDHPVLCLTATGCKLL